MEEIINETPENPEEAMPQKKRIGVIPRDRGGVRVIYLIFGLIAILMVMIYLQSRTDAICCGDWDGYYHIKWLSLVGEFPAWKMAAVV